MKRSNRLRMAEILIERGMHLDTAYSIVTPETNQQAADLHVELKNDGEFYEKTRFVRRRMSEDGKYIRDRHFYLVYVHLFSQLVDKEHKKTPKTVSLVVAKLFVDYYLDELELGNVIL